jgi:mono/diheme cytochrome c family protein
MTMGAKGRGILVAVVLAAATGPARADDGATLARGRTVYRERCAICHGVDGRGDGEGAYLMLRPPRDFHAARFRFVSTWEHVASDDDLYGVITRGLAGSQMPTFAQLSDGDRRALVAVVKAFADVPWTVSPSRAPGADGTPGVGVVIVPPEPADAATDRARGAALFGEACAPCHGAAGGGDGRTDLVDVEGWPIRPRDFATGVFKGDPSPEGIYRRIMVGVPGTPMPANDWAYGDDGWYLVRYVLSLKRPGLAR